MTLPCLFLVLAAPLPPSEEIKVLVQADQAVRMGDLQKKGAIEKMISGDRARRQRIRELLMAGEVRSGEDFSSAALIFHHGESPQDYLLARDLSVVAALKGKFDSLPAYAFDRWLRKMNQPQRFKTQFSGVLGGKISLQSNDEDPRTGVTEALMMDFRVPPVRWMEGAMAGKQDDALLAPMRQRLATWTDKSFQDRQIASPQSKELAALAQKPSDEARERVISLYRADVLRHPRLLGWAAKVLSTSDHKGELLLAVDLSTLAVMRGNREALPTYRTSFDRLLKALGQPPRYSSPRFRLNRALAQVLL